MTSSGATTARSRTPRMTTITARISRNDQPGVVLGGDLGVEGLGDGAAHLRAQDLAEAFDGRGVA